MPINKQLWSSSYAVFSAGMGMLALGAVFWFVDVRGRSAWGAPFTAMGRNAITIFVLSGVVSRLLGILPSPWPLAAEGAPSATLKTALVDVAGAIVRAIPPLDSPQNRSLAYAILFLLAFILLAGLMHRRRIYLKV
jgi:predicted acyltransferase